MKYKVLYETYAFLECPLDCACLCHSQRTVSQVAIDMALLTANANQENFHK